MHPWNSTPVCPRCNKAVFAAEQVMGPGRRLYHKPCLSCAVCKKRLDSFSLVEHDEEPYCKNCHVRTLGTRDLRAQNLPQRQGPASPTSPHSPGQNDRPSSPISNDETSSPPLSPTRQRPVSWQHTGSRQANFLLRPTRALSPTSSVATQPPSIMAAVEPTIPEDAPMDTDEDPAPQPPAPPPDDVPAEEASPTSPTAVPTAAPAGATSDNERDTEDESEVHAMLIGNGREPPMSPAGPARAYKPFTLSRAADGFSRTPVTPLRQSNTGGGAYASYSAITGSRGSPLVVSTPTGTRLGGAQATGGGGTPRWGGSPAPECPRCGKSVFAAEQVRALGKAWHRGCLRCTECGSTLATGKLTEKEGDPYCARCYNKVHGPAGNGYALLGKAGG